MDHRTIAGIRSSKDSGRRLESIMADFHGTESLFNTHEIPVSLAQRLSIDQAYNMKPFLAYQSQTRRGKMEEASVSSQSVKCLSIVISWPACRLARVGVPVGVKISRTSFSKVPFGPFRPCRFS